jgi:hypothetical protein
MPETGCPGLSLGGSRCVHLDVLRTLIRFEYPDATVAHCNLNLPSTLLLWHQHNFSSTSSLPYAATINPSRAQVLSQPSGTLIHNLTMSPPNADIKATLRDIIEAFALYWLYQCASLHPKNHKSMVAQRRADKKWHECPQFKDMKDSLFYEISYNSNEAKTTVLPPLIYWAEVTSMTCTISVDIMIENFKEILQAEIPDVVGVQ